MDLHSPAPLIIRIPLRQVEGVYGPDGLDCATDDLLLTISQITGLTNPNCLVEVDVTSRDSADHALTLEIVGLSPAAVVQFQKKLKELHLG